MGIGGRFYGGYVNYKSNDDHVEVVQRIINGESINRYDCWECFQPGLMYNIHAGIAKLFGHSNRGWINAQLQWQNVFFSLLGLFILFVWLKNKNISPHFSLLIMSFWLVNPAFFGISFQATNDLLIIVIGMAIVFFVEQYYHQKKIFSALCALLLAVLAAYIKGLGIALLLLTFAVVLFLIFQSRIRSHFGLLVPMILGVYLLSFHSKYHEHYRVYGNPFVTNIEKPNPPPFREPDYKDTHRPGINSIETGFLRLPLKNFLEKPYNINSPKDYPIHRTSFWLQMYGSFYHSMFSMHPGTWQSKQPDMLHLVRATFVLGIVPLLLFVWGLLLSIKKVFKQFFTTTENRFAWGEIIHAVFCLGMLVFSIQYAITYRDYGCIKAIFLLPALLSFTWFFMVGLQQITRPKWQKTLFYTLSAIVLLCCINIVFLLKTLSKFYFA